MRVSSTPELRFTSMKPKLLLLLALASLSLGCRGPGSRSPQCGDRPSSPVIRVLGRLPVDPNKPEVAYRLHGPIIALVPTEFGKDPPQLSRVVARDRYGISADYALVEVEVGCGGEPQWGLVNQLTMLRRIDGTGRFPPSLPEQVPTLWKLAQDSLASRRNALHALLGEPSRDAEIIESAEMTLLFREGALVALLETKIELPSRERIWCQGTPPRPGESPRTPASIDSLLDSVEVQLARSGDLRVEAKHTAPRHQDFRVECMARP